MPAAQISKITSKGQTTVPRLVREVLNVGESDYLVWEQHGNTIVVRPGVLQPADNFDALAKRTEARFKKSGVTPRDVTDAMKWARTKSK